MDDFIPINKSKVITVERIFKRGEHEVIITPNGSIDVLNPDEIFALKIGDVYQTFHVLPNKEIQATTIKYKIQD